MVDTFWADMALGCIFLLILSAILLCKAFIDWQEKKEKKKEEDMIKRYPNMTPEKYQEIRRKIMEERNK